VLAFLFTLDQRLLTRGVRLLVSDRLEPRPSNQVGVSIDGCHPPPKHHSTRTRHREQVAIPRRVRVIGSQGAVRAMIVDEVLEVGEKVHWVTR